MEYNIFLVCGLVAFFTLKILFWSFIWFKREEARARQVTVRAVQVVTVLPVGQGGAGPLGAGVKPPSSSTLRDIVRQGGAGPLGSGVKPPPSSTLQDCENPPAYDSIFVNKPPNIGV